MANQFRVLLLIGAALPHGSGATAAELLPEGKPVLAQSLSDNVLWTRRPDRYTLQVLMNWRPAPAEKGTIPEPYGTGKRELPNIEVWLLKKDGTAIPAFKRWQTPASKASPVVSRQPRAEVLYAYPVSAGVEAVAAVICTDGECLVKKIAPFPQ